MAGALDIRADCIEEAGRSREGFVDRWIFVGTALLIIAVVLIGFIPSSLSLLERVANQERGPIPLVLHLHAIFMGSWLMLLLIQAWLMATHRADLHMKLGRVAVLLVPAMVVTGLFLVPASMQEIHARLDGAPPEAEAFLSGFLLPLLNNIMLMQIVAGLLFPLLVFLALHYRRRRPQTHKRLMVMATAVPLAAATDRIAFLPSTLPDNPMTMFIYPLLVLIPLLIWDLKNGGGLDRAWGIFIGLTIVTRGLVWMLWGSDWWSETGPRLVGIA